MKEEEEEEDADDDYYDDNDGSERWRKKEGSCRKKVSLNSKASNWPSGVSHQEAIKMLAKIQPLVRPQHTYGNDVAMTSR